MITNEKSIEEVIESPEVVAEVAEESQEWQPDYKFKVMDKEYEIDEFLRPSLNQDNFDKVKELYTKAYGLDHEKARAERYKADVERYSPFEQKFAEQSRQIGYLGDLLHKKDYSTLFRELAIPEEALTAHTLERLKFRELPPEVQQEREQLYTEKQRAKQLEQENHQLTQQLQGNVSQDRERELEGYLSGQMKSVVEEFDSRLGKTGAFKEAVIERGKLAYYTQKKDISVAEAVGEVLKFSGLNPQAPGPVSTGITANYTSPRETKPIIPNIRGSNMSPVRTEIRNIGDLKKRYNDIVGEE